MKRKKNILIIGGGIESIPGLKVAKSLGFITIVSDYDTKAPAFDFCDYKIISSTYDFKKTAKLAKKFNDKVCKIDGVISLAADVPYTVSFVSKALNLKSNSLETARLSSDKFLMKKRFKKKNIPIPKFWKIKSFDQFLQIANKFGLPLIIKPLDGRGSRGVLLVKKHKDLEFSFKESLRFSKDNYLLVEQFLEGKQISTEALVINGVGYPIGFSDRNYEFLDTYYPFIIENGGDMPTCLNLNDKNLVAKTAIDAGFAMGVENGIVKGDMVLTKDGPKVIEIATRLSGGWFSSDQIPINSGVNIVEYAIKIALNIDFDPIEIAPKHDNGVAIRYFFPSEGKVIRIENLNILKNKDYIYKFQLFIKEGDIIKKITDHTKRAGYVITLGNNKNEAINRANNIIDSIKIITEN